jgi:hypothetical protein
MKAVLRWLVALVAGVVTAAAAGSVAQTQLNLARLSALDTRISLQTRLETTLFDLIHFAPIYAIIVAMAFLIALLTAGAIARALKRGWLSLHILAGFFAVAGALGLMALALPVTAIAAARSATGFMLLCLGGGLGAWVYALVLRPRGHSHLRQNGQN